MFKNPGPQPPFGCVKQAVNTSNGMNYQPQVVNAKFLPSMSTKYQTLAPDHRAIFIDSSMRSTPLPEKDKSVCGSADGRPVALRKMIANPTNGPNL